MKKEFELIIKKKNELSNEYNVPFSSIVYIGNNKFIIVKNGKEIRI